jgi:hypothetical protein
MRLAVPIIPIAKLAFRQFPAFLGLDAQGRNRTSLKTFQANFLTSFFAKSVRSFLNARQGRVDLP